jgi:signal transduction histidine kinase
MPGAIVTGAPVSLRRMIVALVDNALDHAASQVAVVVSTDRGDVVLTVSDDGPGFGDDLRGSAFDRFATARAEGATAGRERHYGLGLALVAEVVDRHGGRVTAADRPPGGAEVTVRLPHAPSRGT